MAEGIRKAPFPRGFWDSEPGICRWCKEPIVHPEGHPLAGQRDTRRRHWHLGCFERYRLFTDPKAQMRFLLKRDGRRCRCGCGKELNQPAGVTAWRWKRRGYEAETTWFGLGHPHLMDGQVWGEYCKILYSLVDLEIEHIVPLWKVDKTKADALWHWGPDNLQLLARSCHARKTSIEAAERAKSLRLQGKPNRKSEWRDLP